MKLFFKLLTGKLPVMGTATLQVHVDDMEQFATTRHGLCECLHVRQPHHHKQAPRLSIQRTF